MTYISPMLGRLMGATSPTQAMFAPAVGQGKAAFPAIFRTTGEGASRSLMAELESSFGVVGQSIPRFRMVNSWATPDVIRAVQSDEEVTHMWFDLPIQVPELEGTAEAAFSDGGPFGFGVVDRFGRASQFIQGMGRPGNRTRADAKWWPTSESRKVLECDKAEADGWTGRGVLCAAIGSDHGPSITMHPQLAGRAAGYRSRHGPRVNRRVSPVEGSAR